MNKHRPFHPIIYVRGFAATQGEIEETVADPYMGFNVGSTKAVVLHYDDEVGRSNYETVASAFTEASGCDPRNTSSPAGTCFTRISFIAPLK